MTAVRQCSHPVRNFFNKPLVCCCLIIPVGMLLLSAWFQRVYGQGFKRLDTRTRSDIQNVQAIGVGSCFFLTNRVYKLDSSAQSAASHPPDLQANVFCAISGSEWWVSQMLETYVSRLYHIQDGITEEIESPFANYITAIHFDSSGTQGLFASWSEVARYHQQSFDFFPPVPTSYAVEKLAFISKDEFWAFTQKGELFHWFHGRYTQLFSESGVIDFQAAGSRSVYVLTAKALLRRVGDHTDTLAVSPLFAMARAFALVAENEQLVVGRNGMIATVANGKTELVQETVTEEYTAASVYGNEMWVAGKGGCLRYKGNKALKVFEEGNSGFSPQRLIVTGLETNNEYGVSLGDVNGDELPDLFAVSLSGPNRLYINRTVSENRDRKIRFSEEAFRRGCSGELPDEDNSSMLSYKLGSVMADVDNDGDQDLYVCHLTGSNQLFLNNGHGFFRSVAHQKDRASEDFKRSNAAAFADVDSDGDLDLFVTSEDSSNRLFANDGTGHFRDITRQSGLETKKGGMCAAFADVNHDGLPDLAVTFWFPGDKIYLNRSTNAEIRFEEITQLTDLAKSKPTKSNGIAFADVNNDGHPDLFIARRNARNSLYLNPGNGHFRDQSSVYLPGEPARLSNGLLFEDLNLDGFTDLYVSNAGKNVFYQNEGGKFFTDMTAVFGLEMEGYGTGLACADVDGDFDPDVYAASYDGGNSMLFINQAETPATAKFRLRGVASNRDAIGAVICLFETDSSGKLPLLAARRELVAGSGYGSASDKEIILALDPEKKYLAGIWFPRASDTIFVPDIRAGVAYQVNETEGWKKFVTTSLQLLKRYTTDREMVPELLKYIMVLLAILCYLWRQQRMHDISTFRYHLIAAGVVVLAFAAVNQLYLFAEKPFHFFIGPMVAAFLLALAHFLILTIQSKQLIRRQQTEIREKLARDLHDDLASTLGSVAIYADTLEQQNLPDKDRTLYLSGKIANLSRQALRAITEIIWMTSPRNDTLQSLVNKTANDMQELFTESNIAFQAETSLQHDPIALEEHLRNNVFLILKEATSNILRHSAAKNVVFEVSVTDGHCRMRLADNGMGMDATRSKSGELHGHGLNNMRRRAQESKLTLSMISDAGRGTEIHLTFKI